MAREKQQIDPLQRMAMLQQVAGQNDPFEAIGGLMALVGALDDRGYKANTDQRQGELLRTQQESAAFDRQMKTKADDRDERALRMGHAQKAFENRVTGATAQAQIDAYKARARNEAGQLEIYRDRNKMDQDELEQGGLLGMMNILASLSGGQGGVLAPMMRFLMERRGIELPGLAPGPDNPQGAQREYIRERLGNSVPFQPTIGHPNY